MALTWQIQIKKTAGGYVYEPKKLTNVNVGDQIIWTNNDDQPHWPARFSQTSDGETTLNQIYFMRNQIAPNSPSNTFVPGVAGTLTYVDSLDQSGNAPQGTIEVS